ncbi:aspartate kinase [bacterium]|nr:MAG: aspartate kinase [bacterium]
MLTVEKIGGTSMSALSDALQNIILYKRSGDELYNRIFVVSAFAGVTDWLLENKKTGEAGIYHRIVRHRNFQKALQDLTRKLQDINQQYEEIGLDLDVANQFIEGRIQEAQRYLEDLSNILASGYVSNQAILQAAREILASIGESHSAFNLVNILQNRGINATLVDLSGFHDNKEYTIDQRIRRSLRNIDFSRTICVVTGYAKGTEGIMREFDRGYSEVAFSKIALAVNPSEAIIHKEYHLSTADPKIVGEDKGIPVGFTNYDVADQLAGIGMEAIHPKASKPLEVNNINLRIKNTFDPDHPGTLISKDFVSQQKRIEFITGSDKLMIIDIYDGAMVGDVGADQEVMQLFQNYRIGYIFKTSSANSISIVIWEKFFDKKLIKELQEKFQQVTVEKVAMVCLISSNMDQPGVLGQAANSLGAQNINIKSSGFALGKVNIQFVIAREDFKKAVIALNETLFFPGSQSVA